MDIMQFIRRYMNFETQTRQWIDRINARPSYPWLNTVFGSFLSIPGLRGFWPMSTHDANGIAQDMTLNNRHLSNTGQAEFAAATTYLAPYVYFDNTLSDYLHVADNADHDITGTETFVSASDRGLTIGGWFRFETLPPATSKGIIGKYDTVGPDRSYMLWINAGASVATFYISQLVAGPITSVVSTLTMTASTWYFIVGRFLPSTELSITVNGTQNEDTNVAAIPASIANSAAQFNVFAYNNGLASTRNHGFASFCFLSDMYLSDNHINHLYEMSRGMFGV